MKRIPKVDNVTLQKLHQQGLSDKELSQYFNVPNQWISIKRRKLNLIENKNSTKLKKLNNEEHEILIGLLLGDGHLIKNCHSRRCGTSGSVVHGLSQKEYIEWLNLKLQRLSTSIRIEHNFNKARNCIESRYAFNFNTHACLNDYYYLFYDEEKKKHITKEIIEQLTPLSLAIWFMDDGAKINSGGYNLFTNGFSKEEQELILPLLQQKFELLITLNRSSKGHSILYISARSAKHFESIISPYIIDFMRYKLHNKIYKNKVTRYEKD